MSINQRHLYMPDIYCLLNIRNFLFLYSVVNIPYFFLHSDIFVLTFIHEHCIVCFLNTHALKLVKFDSNKGENNYDLKKIQRVSQSSFLQKNYSRTVFLRWIRFYVTLRIHVHIQRHFVFWPCLWNKNSMHICRISDCFWCVDFSLRRNCSWATAFHTCMWFFHEILRAPF